ncbi:hypothetical protein [Flavobacterium sp.]|jgi:hypothetical protein|uniref:hypothetical protein n=1 Tax=Flavobacterium sp. TaxID=239 RepID=UPI0037C14E9A
MKNFLFFVFMISISSSAFSQFDSNIKFKSIPPANTKPKSKKELPPPSNLPKLVLPKIVAPNVFTATNIFGTKPKPSTAFEFGTAENQFSMTLKNKFEHKMGDVYQEKMAKDLDKTMIREGLKEDTSFLDRKDRDLGEFKTKSDFLLINYRDYIQIDGDLITIYVNDKLFRSQLFLYSQMSQVKIPLAAGINKVELVVASTGTSGGNTAEIHASDDAGKAITEEYWNNLALGTKIKLIVIKE